MRNIIEKLDLYIFQDFFEKLIKQTIVYYTKFELTMDQKERYTHFYFEEIKFNITYLPKSGRVLGGSNINGIFAVLLSKQFLANYAVWGRCLLYVAKG